MSFLRKGVTRNEKNHHTNKMMSVDLEIDFIAFQGVKSENSSGPTSPLRKSIFVSLLKTNMVKSLNDVI